MRPKIEDHIPYFSRYIDLVTENEIMAALKNDHHTFIEFVKAIPPEKSEHFYAPGKWTIKQVINHIIDTERIFSYRALRFARADAQAVAGFEENDYAANANLKHTDLNLLTEEFDVVRQATILLFRQLEEKEMARKGMMASGETNVLALGFTICGHAKHHINIIKERYL